MGAGGWAFRAGGGHGRPPAFPISRTWGGTSSPERRCWRVVWHSTRLVENTQSRRARRSTSANSAGLPRLSAQMPPPGRCLSASTISARSSSTHTSARHHLRLVEQGAESAVVGGHRQGRVGSDGSMLSVVVTDDDRAPLVLPPPDRRAPRCPAAGCSGSRASHAMCSGWEGSAGTAVARGEARLTGQSKPSRISAPHSAEFACAGAAAAVDEPLDEVRGPWVDPLTQSR
jgi:hypothetical protein